MEIHDGDEDLLSFTSQLPPLDIRGSDYFPLDWEHELSIQDHFLDPSYSSSSLQIQENKSNDDMRDDEDTTTTSTCNQEEKRSSSRSNSIMLSKETISQHFYMPISEAAKQMNVGVTFLKRRCRDLGITCWPYRKFASLQTLVQNIHELGEDAEVGELLERERKLMEEVPNLQLEGNTKRLRQSCFKAIYKKKRERLLN